MIILLFSIAYIFILWFLFIFADKAAESKDLSPVPCFNPALNISSHLQQKQMHESQS